MARDRFPVVKALPLVASPACVLALLGLSALAGCEPAGSEITDRTLEVGCGTCQLGQTTHPGCWWAAKIDGEVIPMRGEAIPSDAEHDGHGPDGMCNMMRRAVVSGRLHESHLAVTKLELTPADPGDIPDHSPHEHRH